MIRWTSVYHRRQVRAALPEEYTVKTVEEFAPLLRGPQQNNLSRVARCPRRSIRCR